MPFTWVAETAGILASASLLVALIIILAVYDGKVVFEWKGVTLNAVISVLSTASKAALLYTTSELLSQWKWIVFTTTRRPLLDFQRIDAASRGPLGSLEITWRSRETWLRLGALVVVLSIAADPLNQQLIQYKQGVIYSPDTSATINRAGRYAKGAQTFLGVPIRSNGEWYNNTNAVKNGLLDNLTTVAVDADLSMQSSILYGIDQPMENVIQQGRFDCPTGNCTWPPFESLAVCNRCIDVKEKFEMIAADFDQYFALGTDNSDAPGGHLMGNPATAFRLPNGLYLSNRNWWRYGTDGASCGAVIMTSLGTANATETVGANDLDTLIWSMSMIRVMPDAGSAAWPDLQLSAIECSLFYCVNSYEFKVSNNTLTVTNEQVADAKRAKDSWDIPEWAKVAFNEVFNETVLESIAFQKYYSGFRRTDLVLSSPVSGRRFNISQAAVDSISSYYQSTFAAELLNLDISDSETGRLNGYYVNSSEAQTEYEPSVMQILFASQDLNATFTTLAASMSNAIRTGSDETFEGLSNIVTGSKGELTTFYRVVWPWISLHCFIVIAGMVFLLLTVRENKRHGWVVPAWKSSSLAVLKRGHEMGGILSGMQTVEQMEAMSKTSEVVFFDIEVESSSLEHLDFDPLEAES